MNFKSWAFVIFILLSLFCYYIISKKHRWMLLLVSSIVFYAFTGFFNLAFILFTSIITFFCAITVEKINSNLQEKKANVSKENYKIEKMKAISEKRKILFFALLFVLGVLVVLKYVLPFSGSNTLLLPLGISFYTFQTVAYFIDVYNGKYESEKSFFRYLLFVSFFPQLIMGPINRYDKLGFQLKENHSFDFENFKHGFMLILFGALKKYCIADLLVKRVDAVLDSSYMDIPGFFIGGAVVIFSIYQYADFSGGIDMCLGFAKLFGIDMQPNFRQPYFATSLADFWRRWHISLGLWMKDYVFYPLALTKRMQGISKCFLKKENKFARHLARTVPAGIGNIVVFLLVGIWHGSELHYVLWGLYNGLVIAFSDLLKPVFEKLNIVLKINVKAKSWKVFQILRTFFIVNVGAYFDRIVDVKRSFIFLKRTFCSPGFSNLKNILTKSYIKNIFGSLMTIESEIMIMFMAGLIVFLTSIMRERKIDVYKLIQNKNMVVRWGVYYLLMLLIVLSFSFAPDNPVFMYAQY